MRALFFVLAFLLPALLPSGSSEPVDDCTNACIAIPLNTVPVLPAHDEQGRPYTYYVTVAYIGCRSNNGCLVDGLLYQESNHLASLQILGGWSDGRGYMGDSPILI